MKRNLILLTLIFIAVSACIRAQSSGVGLSVGGGYISGDSPSITSVNIALFADVDVGFRNVHPRFSFIYATDFDNIVPGSRNNYYPFIKGFSLKAVITQDFEKNYFLEEALGAAYLNDRTFSFTDSWNAGIVFSLLVGMNFTDFYKQGFLIGIGTEYAFAFGGTFPKYFTIQLQTKYNF